MVKNLPANAGKLRDAGLISGLGRSPGGENGNALQCSCLENPVDRGAWWAAVHGLTKSWTRLSPLHSTGAYSSSNEEMKLILFHASRFNTQRFQLNQQLPCFDD